MLTWMRKYFPLDWLTLTFLITLALGATVRLVGINYDLPLITHPDEPRMVDSVIDMIERRSFEPREFTWPAHVVMMVGYIISVFYSYLVLGLQPEAAINLVGDEHWYLATRIGVAIFGIIGIVLAYFIGAKLKREIGVVAAVFVAFFPFFVHHSHLATADIPLAVTVMAVVLAAMNYLEKPGYAPLLAMSFFTAFAIAIKYPGLIAAGMIAIVVAIRAITDKDLRRFVSHGFASLFALGVSLFVISPVLFTRRGQVLRRLDNESRDTHLGADGKNFWEKLEFYWSVYYGSSGWLLIVPLIIGIVAIIRFWLVLAVPILIGVLFWVSLSTLGLHHTRWGMPMFITPLLVSAVGVYFLFDAVSKKLERFKKPVTAGLVAMSVVATANMITSSVVTAADFLRLDTRAIATEDFERREITEGNSVYEGYTVHYPNGPFRVFHHFAEIDGQLIPVDDSFDYVVISSSMHGRYMADSRYVDQQRFYRILEDTYPLVVQYRAVGRSGSVTNPLTNVPISIAHIRDIYTGASTKGPTIKVFAVPDQVRQSR